MTTIREFKKTWIVDEPKRIGGSCYVTIPKFLEHHRIRVTVELILDDKVT